MQLSLANGFVFMPDLDIVFHVSTHSCNGFGLPLFLSLVAVCTCWQKLLHICALYPWHIASIMAADGLVPQGSKAWRMVTFLPRVKIMARCDDKPIGHKSVDTLECWQFALYEIHIQCNRPCTWTYASMVNDDNMSSCQCNFFRYLTPSYVHAIWDFRKNPYEGWQQRSLLLQILVRHHRCPRFVIICRPPWSGHQMNTFSLRNTYSPTKLYFIFFIFIIILPCLDRFYHTYKYVVSL